MDADAVVLQALTPDIAPVRITMPRARSDMLPRPRLDVALQAALKARRLVLLCAPAGYGKTTALVQQLSGPASGLARAWISVAEEDSLPSLLAHLLAALDPLDLPWRQSTDGWPTLVLAERGRQAVVAALQLALEHADVEHGVIVLDDLHRLADARALAFLDQLIGLLPERWTLALTSRQPPALALARLRLQGEVAEFGESELRFEPSQVQQLLLKQQADSAAAEPLYRATQGWPVGAVTLSRALKGATLRLATSPERRRLFDYLASEVLEGLPPGMREFLLRCSVLRELTVARCREVSADERAGQWLAELERRELFVSALDTGELTLRLHDLFREFLEARLLLEMAGEYPALLVRAAAGETDLVLRLRMLLRAGDDEGALAELARHAVDIVLDGQDARLLQLVEQFPAELGEAPELAFARGMCAWHAHRWLAMTEAMSEAAVAFERQGRQGFAQQARAFAGMGLVWSGQHERAVGEWRRQPGAADADGPSRVPRLMADHVRLATYGPAPEFIRNLWQFVEALRSPRDLRWVAFSIMFLGHMRWGTRRALEALERSLTAAADDDHPRLKTAALTHAFGMALWRAEFERSDALLAQLLQECAWLGDSLTVKLPLAFSFAFQKHVFGAAEEARRALQGIREVMQASPERKPWFVLAALAHFATADGDVARAEAVREEIVALVPDQPFLPFALAALEAEIKLLHGDAAAAADCVRNLLEAAAHADALNTLSRLHAVLARAEQRLGRPEAAWQALRPLLQEVQASGNLLVMLLLGPAALGELAQAPWPARAEPALLDLLASVSGHARTLRQAGAPAPAAREAAPLSEREQEVLALIAQGHSNKHIARALGLSPHTVKRHVARILDRTGQTSRIAAASWLQQAQQAGARQA